MLVNKQVFNIFLIPAYTFHPEEVSSFATALQPVSRANLPQAYARLAG